MSKKRLALLLLITSGLLLRLVVMPFSLHWDFLFIHQFPHLLVSQGITNIYWYIAENFPASVAMHGWNYYPPLTYLFFAAYQWFIQPIAPTLSTFLSAVNVFDAQGGGFLHEFFLTMRSSDTFWNILVLKFPFLIFELILLGFLVWLRPQKKRALILYILFHPIIFYATYLFGQLDLLPTTLVVASFAVAFLPKGSSLFRHTIAMMLLGLAVGFKTFPIFLFLPAILLFEQTFQRRILLLVVGLLPIVILTLPFLSTDLPLWRIWLPPFVFTTNQLGIVGLMKKIVHIGFYIVAIFLSYKHSGTTNVRLISGVFLLTLLPIYNFTQFSSLHFVMWAMPFLPLWFNRVRSAYIISWLLFFGLLGFKIMNWQHQFGLFVSLNPMMFSSLPTVADVVRFVLPTKVLTSVTYMFYHLLLFLMTLSILFRLVAFDWRKK